MGIPARAAVRTWKYFLNYRAFNDLNREKLRMSHVGISFSRYLAKRIGGGEVIYHGAEPAVNSIGKQEARSFFSLPQDRRIALVLGFRTATKGWDILDKMDMPEGWVMVVNSSKGHYNTENLSLDLQSNIIDLQRGFLGEEQLSMLLFAADAVILPYKITSGSGVMFDALAHGLPFVASDLEFFREFSSQGLGVTVKRIPEDFSKGLQRVSREYGSYAQAVSKFKEKLKWEYVAKQHVTHYISATAASVQAN